MESYYRGRTAGDWLVTTACPPIILHLLDYSMGVCVCVQPHENLDFDLDSSRASEPAGVVPESGGDGRGERFHRAGHNVCSAVQCSSEPRVANSGAASVGSHVSKLA